MIVIQTIIYLNKRKKNKKKSKTNNEIQFKNENITINESNNKNIKSVEELQKKIKDGKTLNEANKKKLIEFQKKYLVKQNNTKIKNLLNFIKSQISNNNVNNN